MVFATLYIMWCTAKNRIRRRLQRLREPRYLLGAVVAVVYFCLRVLRTHTAASANAPDGRTGGVGKRRISSRRSPRRRRRSAGSRCFSLQPSAG